MVRRISLDEARIKLPQLVRRVRRRRQYLIVEQDGVAVAGVMNPEELEDYLELQDAELNRQIETGYAEYQRGKATSARAFLARLPGGGGQRPRRP